jgi:hypothetical protein
MTNLGWAKRAERSGDRVPTTVGTAAPLRYAPLAHPTDCVIDLRVFHKFENRTPLFGLMR